MKLSRSQHLMYWVGQRPAVCSVPLMMLVVLRALISEPTGLASLALFFCHFFQMSVAMGINLSCFPSAFLFCFISVNSRRKSKSRQ